MAAKTGNAAKTGKKEPDWPSSDAPEGTQIREGCIVWTKVGRKTWTEYLNEQDSRRKAQLEEEMRSDA